MKHAKRSGWRPFWAALCAALLVLLPLVGGTVLLLSLDVRFGLVLLFSLPVLLLTVFWVLSRAVPLFTRLQKKLDRVNSVLEENITGARIVKASVREASECQRFDGANRELRDVNYRALRMMAVVQPVLLLVQNGAIIAILLLGSRRIAAGVAGMSTGNLMAAVTYTTQILSSVMMVAMIFQSASRAIASAGRVREVNSRTRVVFPQPSGALTTVTRLV